MNPRRTPTVAPLNWKATHMLGMKIAPKRTMTVSPALINANLKLSEAKGLAEGKRRPSKFRRSGQKMIGKISTMWQAQLTRTISLIREPNGMPRLASKLESTSGRVDSPNRRKPKEPVIRYTTAQRVSEVRTTTCILEGFSSSFSMV